MAQYHPETRHNELKVWYFTLDETEYRNVIEKLCSGILDSIAYPDQINLVLRKVRQDRYFFLFSDELHLRRIHWSEKSYRYLFFFSCSNFRNLCRHVFPLNNTLYHSFTTMKTGSYPGIFHVTFMWMTELMTGSSSVHRRHLEFTYLYVMAETTQLMSFQELLFNVDTGYLEALVRGFRSGILTQSDYLNLSQCETLEGNDHL